MKDYFLRDGGKLKNFGKKITRTELFKSLVPKANKMHSENLSELLIKHDKLIFPQFVLL